MVEYVYNSTKYKSIGITPFEAEYGLNPNIYRPKKKDQTNNE